ncbi:integral membrane protein [Massarina eburnea CBS 473.64]|uniref:Integral membrane protein n=1 Tax=Massarina eburnea CBS 473.64 TaxID=1395130 RepID=A0A6A6SKD3_9PLEO|nr:integral membrane protein [Massarina eburnea CBS 473.64]
MSAVPEMSPDVAQEDKGPAILAICSTLTALATLFVAARLYVRVNILSRAGLDDWLIVISMICVYVTLGLTVAAVSSGNGRHFPLLTTEQKSGAILYTIAGFCPGVFSFGIPKLAVVALLTRITNPTRKHRIFLWTMTIGCLVLLFGCVIILFAQCSPSRSQWDFSVQGTCWSPWVLIYYSIVAGGLSATTDFYLAIYPAVVLYSLQINLKKKLALGFALGLGSVAGGVAIYKCTRLPGLASQDFSYDTSDITIWTSIEGNSIIIGACIPTLQPLFDRFIAKGFFSSNDPQSNKKSTGYGSHTLATPKIELATIGSGARRTTKSYKKMGISDMTMGQDSEESILNSERNENSEEHVLENHNGILRTQHVAVEYGA